MVSHPLSLAWNAELDWNVQLWNYLINYCNNDLLVSWNGISPNLVYLKIVWIAAWSRYIFAFFQFNRVSRTDPWFKTNLFSIMSNISLVIVWSRSRNNRIGLIGFARHEHPIIGFSTSGETERPIMWILLTGRDQWVKAYSDFITIWRGWFYTELRARKYVSWGIRCRCVHHSRRRCLWCAVSREDHSSLSHSAAFTSH